MTPVETLIATGLEVSADATTDTAAAQRDRDLADMIERWGLNTVLHALGAAADGAADVHASYPEHRQSCRVLRDFSQMMTDAAVAVGRR